MRRQDIPEFHHITAFANVASVLSLGILSHDRAKGRQRVDIADPEVQERRRAVRVPTGRPLHTYACSYVDARNAMLFRLLREGRTDLAVMSIDVAVLDLDNVVVTDRNAASGVALFYDPTAGIDALERDAVFATWWNQDRDTMQRRCAEVLVPERIPPELISHIYVASRSAVDDLRRVAGDLTVDVRVNARLFFGEGQR